MAGGDCCLHEVTQVEDSMFDGVFGGWRLVCSECGEQLGQGCA